MKLRTYFINVLVVLASVLPGLSSFSQESVRGLYNPAANSDRDLAELMQKATLEKKNVFIIAGGNWCSWCIEFNRFSHAEAEVDSLLKKDFIVYHLNYSPENKNVAFFTKYGHPERFGFPVFLIVDENGNRLHTQNSEYLEQGKSYNKRKVTEFLKQWNRSATGPVVINTGRQVK